MLKYNMNNNQEPIYNRIVLFDRVIPDRQNNLIFIEPNDYKETLNSLDEPIEYISLSQVKPYFDVEIYNPKIFTFNELTELIKIISDIKNVLDLENDRDIHITRREPREVEHENKKCIKYSYHFIVDNIRISYITLLNLIKSKEYKDNKPFDISVYKKNSGLYPIYSNKKNDVKTKKIFTVPELLPYNIYNGLLTDIPDITKYCPSYIEEDFKDYDIKYKPKEVKFNNNNNNNNNNEDDEDDEDETPDKYNRLVGLINRIKQERSNDFDSWIKLNWCIINICNKEGISRRKCSELIHQFSKISKNNYNEDNVDNWIDKNYDNVREKGYSWNYLLHTCIKEDDPKYYENISQSYFNMKKEFEKNNVKILYPPMIIHKDRDGENILQPIPLCEKTNRHLKCSIKEETKKGEIYKNKKFIELWLDDSRIRKYDKYVFKPYPLKIEDYEYNTWTDLEITKTPYIENSNIIDRFLEYLNNLFNDEKVVNYILAYFANRIQNPSVRNKVCIILYGEEGDGKNRLFDIFKNIFGNKYFTELESAKQLFGAHSCIEKEKLFICVNEAKGKDNYENSDILKARITTDKIIVNPKGIQEFQISNYCDYIMTTNNNNAVNLHDKSRRYLYVETTSYYSRNSEFFNSFSNDIVDNEGSLRVIYEYLKKFDVKEIIPSGNFQNHIPETEIQKEIIKNNRDKILYFLEDYVEQFKDIETEFIMINNQALYDAWNYWVSNNKIDIKYNNIAFHTRLALLIKKKINIDKTIIRKDTNKNNFIYHHQLIEFFVKLNNDI